MGEPEIDDLILPTIGGDLPSFLWVVLGVPKTTANRWCVFGKLNLRLVFDYFSSSGLPKGERPRSYYLRAFCLCALPRYFLIQQSHCVDLRMCPSAPTFLGILGIVGFKMSWGLKHTWNLWAALRRPTFSGLWNGGISQAWFTIVARTIM